MIRYKKNAVYYFMLSQWLHFFLLPIIIPKNK